MNPTTTIEQLTFTVPADRNGPAGMANGGWLVGRLAEALGLSHATVTLRAPTRLEAACELEAGPAGGVLRHEGTVLAEAQPANQSPLPPRPVPLADAAIAEAHFAGRHEHPFPTCFVCGTERAVGDGLRIFPGPVEGRPGTVAAWWTPDEAFAGPDGTLPTSVVSAALDCPTGWAHYEPGGVALLGRLTIAHVAPVHARRDLVVVATRQGRSGRKLTANAGIYDRAGQLLASSSATWITI